MKAKKTLLIVTCVLIGSLTTACSTKSVVNGAVDTTGFVAKTAVNGTIGAGKLAVNGVRAVAGSGE